MSGWEGRGRFGREERRGEDVDVPCCLVISACWLNEWAPMVDTQHALIFGIVVLPNVISFGQPRAGS